MIIFVLGEPGIVLGFIGSMVLLENVILKVGFLFCAGAKERDLVWEMGRKKYFADFLEEKMILRTRELSVDVGTGCLPLSALTDPLLPYLSVLFLEPQDVYVKL